MGMQEEEPLEETDTMEFAEVQAALDETIDNSKQLENLFEDDAEGTAYRRRYFKEALAGKISDSNKRSICGNEFYALKTAFYAIVDDYTNLPTKLKAQVVQRVPFEFAETDLGSTDLEDSKNLCDFAGNLVSKLKKAESQHKKRLTAARALVCTEASKLLKLISDMGNCLHKAQKDAAGTEVGEETAYAAAVMFDQHALQRVMALLYLTKNKCLMKDTLEAEPARVAGMFRETLRTPVTRKTGALTDDDKEFIAKKFNDAVERKYPSATNIMTVFTQTEETHNRRQLEPRRALADGVHAVTTWDLDFPTKTTAYIRVNLGADYVSSEPERSSQPTSGSIEVTQPMTPIDDNLPDGVDEMTSAATTRDPLRDEAVSSAPTEERNDNVPEATDTGAIEAAVGAVALVCTTVWFF